MQTKHVTRAGRRSPECQAPPALKEQQRELPVDEDLLHILGLVTAGNTALPVPQQLAHKGGLFSKALKFSSQQSHQALPLSRFLGFLPAGALFLLLA